MSFYDGLNEYAATKIIKKETASGLENILLMAEDVNINTSLNEIFSFCSSISGVASLFLALPSSSPTDGCKVYDNGIEMPIAFNTSGSYGRTATIEIIAGHIYVIKARINAGTGKADAFLNGTIKDNPRFFIKKI